MTQNIVDAYRKAVSKSEKEGFHDVISFCENDKKCREDTSLKKNVLMFNVIKRFLKKKIVGFAIRCKVSLSPVTH